MPFDPIPVPAYPDVPYAPGVPAVARAVAFDVGATLGIVALADGAGLSGIFAPKPWGIFTSNGQPAFDGDSVVGVEVKADMQIPTYPLEQGGFASYNKVQLPYDARITYTVGGNDTRRGQFLAAVDAALRSLTLYTVTMPEFFYAAANIIHYDFARRSNNGVGLLTVSIWLQEVRQTATSAFSDNAGENQGQGPVDTPQLQSERQILHPLQPSGASPTSVGPVQPQSPSNYSSAFGPDSTPHFFGSPSLDPFAPKTTGGL